MPTDDEHERFERETLAEIERLEEQYLGTRDTPNRDDLTEERLDKLKGRMMMEVPSRLPPPPQEEIPAD